MGYADRSYSYRPGGGSRGSGGGGRLLGSFSMTPWVKRLLVANGAIWLLNAVQLLPRAWTIEAFGFSPGGLLTHPWSPVTYMFVHGGFWHVFVNMLVLFFFGPPLERAWGGREFLKFYLVAGLGGALISLALLPTPAVAPETMVVGASGAIFGVMLAFALEWPEAKVYIWGVLPIRAKWFVGILAAFAFVSTSASLFGDGGGRVAHWAHLGGLVTGFAYLRWGGRVSRALDAVFDRIEGAVAAVRPSDGGASGPRSRRTTSRGRPSAGTEGGREIRFPAAGGDRGGGAEPDGGSPPDEDTLDEVDRILDKIREHGLDSLTDEEREFLDEMSRRYRG